MKKSSFFKIPWARFGAKPKSRPKKKKNQPTYRKVILKTYTYTKNIILIHEFTNQKSICRMVVLLLQSYMRNGGLIVANQNAERQSYCRKPKCRMVVLLLQSHLQNGGLIIAIVYGEWWSYRRRPTCRMVVELSLKAAAESLDSAAKL